MERAVESDRKVQTKELLLVRKLELEELWGIKLEVLLVILEEEWVDHGWEVLLVIPGEAWVLDHEWEVLLVILEEEWVDHEWEVLLVILGEELELLKGKQ